MNALAPLPERVDFWPVEPLYRGETIFCLASGPSLTDEVCAKVKGRRTIVVNTSCNLAPWADVLYFTDSGWYEQRREIVKNWPGHVMSMSRTAKRELPDKVKRIQGCGDPNFKPIFRPGAEFIQQGRSSGHTAVSLAISLSAAPSAEPQPHRRIALCGYDMRIVDGREHHHAEYQGPRDLDQYAREFVPTFNGWRDAALKVGAEIVNCTVGSAITEFPFVDLDEALT